MARKKMGEMLIEQEIISQQDLNKALLKQKGQDKPLGQILEEMNLVQEEDIAKTLASQFNFPYVKKIARFKFPPKTLAMINGNLALKRLIFPLKLDNKILYLAMANPLDMPVQSELAFQLGVRISPCVATPEEIQEAIKVHYNTEISSGPIVKSDHPTLLVVDSQPMILSTLENLLKKEGYAVHLAQDGHEGLQLAHQLQPDLIVTEINLPRLDGTRLFAEVRRSSELSHTKVIIFTTKASQEEEARLLDMGVDDFIAKPLQPLRLMARIRRALR